MPLLTLPHAPSLTVRARALVFEDPASQALLAHIGQVAPSDATVLIVGETGTGKEIIARHLHQLSRRRDQPFVAVNCGALTETLVEAELFGHEKGAFTGALTSKPGWFEAAHGGTLFLDEIGDLPLAMQVKLLRVLQEREVVRLGSRHPIPIDVRLVAATNVALDDAVSAGRFREDLYYRLAVATLDLPALRDRPGDILPLAQYFLQVYAQRLGVGPAQLTREAELALLEHGWPGNIRELENVVHQALLVCREGRVDVGELRLSARRPLRAVAARPESPPAAHLETALRALFERNPPDLWNQIEGTVMRAAYDFCDRNQVQTARLLGLSRNIVRARLIQCGALDPGRRRPDGERGHSAANLIA